MATGVGFGFDLKFLEKLQEADKLLEKMTNGSNRLKASTISAFQDMTTKGVVPFVKELERQKKMFEEVGNIKGGGKNAMFNRLRKDAADTVNEINKVILALEKTKGYRNEASGKTAISFANKTLGARGDKSIDNLRLALSKLEAAQNRQNLNTKRGQANYEKLGQTIARVKNELDKVSNASDKVRAKHNELSQTAQKLRGVFTTIFSISAIKQYIHHLTKIRGEFELQQRSLQAILQNKHDADMVWAQTIALAKKSPFEVKDLVKYTKQLAAYRIEADKLNETTKMLGDISSGVGVDMQRLILAFGQVKAANYLRGTELRQFSEAGVNILDELAKRFTEVEGRAISVGEVFEMVSKRMVSFEDVEAVLKDMTGEGGIFYNMQEIQAETLEGLRRNLKDSVNLMLNEIGENNDGILKGYIQLLKSAADNWRDVAAAMKMAIPFMLLWNAGAVKSGKAMTKYGDAILRGNKVVKENIGAQIKHIASLKLSEAATFGLTKKQALLAKATMRAQVGLKALGASLMSFAPYAIIAGIAALVSHLTSSWREAQKLKKELRSIENEGFNEAMATSTEYKILADTVADATKSYDEQQKALKTLRDKYQDILPTQYLEIETIKSMAGNYDAATTAINNYIAAKTKEKQVVAIQETYGERIESQRNRLIGALQPAINLSTNEWVREKYLKPVVAELENMLNNGEIGLSDVTTTLEEIIKRRLGLIVNLAEGSGEAFAHAILGMRTEIENLTSAPFDWGNNLIFGKVATEINQNLKEFEDDYAKHIKTIQEYNKKATEGNIPEKLKEDYEKAYAWLNKFAWRKDWNSIVQNPFDLKDAGIDAIAYQYKHKITTLREYVAGLREELASGELNMQDAARNQATIDAVEQFIEELEGRMNSLNLDIFNKEISRAIEELQEDLQVPDDAMAGLEGLFKKSDESVVQYVERVGKELAETEKLVKDYEYSLKQCAEGIQNANLVPSISQDDYNRLQLQLPLLKAWYDMIKPYGTENKPKSSGTRPKNTFDARLKILKDLNKEYKDLTKNYSTLEAKEIAISKFEPAFKEAFAGTSKTIRDFSWETEEGILNALDWLSKFGRKADRIKAKQARAEFAWEIEIETKIKHNKKLIKNAEDLFKELEVAEEFADLGINVKVPLKILGVEITNLEELQKELVQDYFIDQLSKVSTVYATGANAKEGGTLTRSETNKYAATLGSNNPSLTAEYEKLIAAVNKAAEGVKTLTDAEKALIKQFLGDDLANLFLGNLNEITISLDELREMFAKTFGSDVADALFEDLVKISKREEDKLKSDLLSIENMYKKSFNDRTQLMIDYYAARNKIIKTYNEAIANAETEEGKQQIESRKHELLSKIAVKYATDLNKLEKEMFLSSDNYVRIFNNIEKASHSSLTSMQKDLDAFVNKYKNSLTTTELEELIQKQEQLAKAINKTKNPWENVKVLTEKIEADMKSIANFESIGDYYEYLGTQIYDVNNQISNTKTAIDTLSAMIESSDENSIFSLSEVDAQKLQTIKSFVESWWKDTEGGVPKSIENLLVELNSGNVNVATLQTLLDILKNGFTTGDANQQLVGGLGVFMTNLSELLGSEEDVQALIDALNELGNTYQELFAEAKKASDAVQQVGELANWAIGGDLAAENLGYITSATGSVIDTFGSALAASEQLKAAGVNAQGFAKALNGIATVSNWVVAVIQILYSVIKAIADYKQNKITKQIERHNDAISRLEREYQKLEDAMDKAYDIQQMERYFDEMNKKLDEQMKHAAAAKAAAESGKDNEENIKAAEDAQRQYDELLKQTAELAEERFSEITAGIFDDTISSAEGFIDAWMEAYQEVGNGMSGLTEHFEEELMNVVKRQAALQIVGQYVEYWKSMLNGITEDKNFSLESYIEAVKGMLPDLAEDLEEYFKSMPFTSNNELSGIEKGIQGITADQADVLAAYWNSVRFLTASIDQKFDIPLSQFFSDDVTFNPMLNQLRQIAGNTAQIRDLLSSVIDINGGKKAIRMK